MDCVLFPLNSGISMCGINDEPRWPSRYCDYRTRRTTEESWFGSRQGQTFSSPKRLDRLWGLQFEWVIGFISPGVKRPEREADHSPRSVEVREWICTTTSWCRYFYTGNRDSPIAERAQESVDCQHRQNIFLFRILS